MGRASLSRNPPMRVVAMAFVGALGLAASAVSASAAPPVANLDVRHETNIIAVAGGCGGGFHPNRWGRCVPNRDGYSDRAYPRWGGFYGGGDGYEPWNRPSPTDHIARELNRRQLYGGY